MTVVERHTSPDGVLNLIVDLTDGDWSIGFDGCAWHTHGDILYANGYPRDPAAATRQFVDDILADRCVIVISRVQGEIRDVWIRDDPDSEESEYASDDEVIELRLWSGTEPKAAD